MILTLKLQARVILVHNTEAEIGSFNGAVLGVRRQRKRVKVRIKVRTTGYDYVYPYS